MGSHVTKLLRQYGDRSRKTAFLSTILIGILVHMYKFSNTLLITDSLSNFYATQNILPSGRWFLEIACAPSTFFDLPWVTGLFSLFWIAATTVVIVDLFRMDNPVQIMLTGALLVTFPTVTEIFFYQYTADGYMLAMFLAALSVRLTTIEQRKIRYWILAAVCLACVCGIYQTYVSFALMLMLGYWITILLDGKYNGKTCLLWGLAQAGLYAVSMVLYFVIWKICMAVQHTVPTDYQGIDDLGSMSLGSYIIAAKSAVVQFLDFFLNGLLSANRNINTWLVLNILFLIGFAAILLVSFFRLKVFKDKLRTVLIALAVVCAPFASFLWLFASENVSYLGMRMKHCFCIVYILAAVLYEKYARLQWKNVAAVLLSALCMMHALTANIQYYNMQQYWNKSMSAATEIVTRIHAIDSGKAKYLVVVGLNKEAYNQNYVNKTRLGAYYGRSLNSLLNRERDTALFLGNVLDFQLKYYTDHPQEKPTFAASETSRDGSMNCRISLMDEQARNELITSDAVQQMDEWPASGSIAEIGDAIVLKFSEEEIDPAEE